MSVAIAERVLPDTMVPSFLIEPGDDAAVRDLRSAFLSLAGVVQPVSAHAEEIAVELAEAGLDGPAADDAALAFAEAVGNSTRYKMLFAGLVELIVEEAGQERKVPTLVAVDSHTDWNGKSGSGDPREAAERTGQGVGLIRSVAEAHDWTAGSMSFEIGDNEGEGHIEGKIVYLVLGQQSVLGEGNLPSGSLGVDLMGLGLLAS